jgi:hypothetical protein
MKRFTETDKWLDPWFQELPLDAKLVWLYLLDRCDNAGVWEPNKRLANFTIGRDIDWPEVERLLTVGARIEVLPDGKWHVCKFVVFQYGKLSKECAPHRQVLRLIERHGLHASDSEEKEIEVKPFRKAYASLKDKDKDKDKDTELIERPRDLIFEALCRIQGSDYKALTKPERGKVNAARKEIIAATPGVTAQEIEQRAIKLARLWPNAKVTANSLSAHWSECQVNRPAATLGGMPEFPNWRQRMKDEFPDWLGHGDGRIDREWEKLGQLDQKAIAQQLGP